MDLLRQVAKDIILLGSALGIVLLIVALVLWIRVAIQISHIGKSTKIFIKSLSNKLDGVLSPLSNIATLGYKALMTETSKNKKKKSRSTSSRSKGSTKTTTKK